MITKKQKKKKKISLKKIFTYFTPGQKKKNFFFKHMYVFLVRFNPHCKEWEADFDEQKHVLLDALQDAFSFNHGRQIVTGAHVSYFGYT